MKKLPEPADGLYLCPICGEQIKLIGQTTDGRLIGSCNDAFTEQQWAGSILLGTES